MKIQKMQQTVPRITWSDFNWKAENISRRRRELCHVIGYFAAKIFACWFPIFFPEIGEGTKMFHFPSIWRFFFSRTRDWRHRKKFGIFLSLLPFTAVWFKSFEYFSPSLTLKKREIFSKFPLPVCLVLLSNQFKGGWVRGKIFSASGADLNNNSFFFLLTKNSFRGIHF